MSRADFDACTPGEFRAVYEQWAQRERQAERGAWERMRLLGVCMLQPYAKGTLRARDVMRFPWEEAEDHAPAEERKEESREEVMARYAAAKARYGLR